MRLANSADDTGSAAYLGLGLHAQLFNGGLLLLRLGLLRLGLRLQQKACGAEEG